VRTATNRTASFIAAIVTALMVGVGIGFAIGHLTAGGSNGGGGPSQAAGSMIHVHGTFTLTDSTGFNHPSDYGATCHGISGYSDIAPGAEVVISDDAGKTLSITGLDQGFVTANSTCQFTFTATVPAGLKFYGIEISHRGTVKETEQGMHHPSLTLGS
jgi:hypothetical protein